MKLPFLFEQLLSDLSWASLEIAKTKKSSDTIYIIGDGASLRHLSFRRQPPGDLYFINHSVYRSDFRVHYPKCVFSSLIEPFGLLSYRLYPSIRSPRKIFMNSLFNKHFNYCSEYSILPIYHISSYLNTFGDRILAYNTIPFSSLSLTINSLGLSTSHGSVFYAMAFAESLRYKRIYLLGCDYLLKKVVVGHWFETVFETPSMYQPYNDIQKIVIDFALNELPIVALDPFDRDFICDSTQVSHHQYIAVNQDRPKLCEIMNHNDLADLKKVRPRLYSIG